jgi:mRNA interferase MazF
MGWRTSRNEGGAAGSGQRPALVISADALNQSPAGLVIVVSIIGTDRGIPAHVRVDVGEGGLTKPSVIMADQVRTVSLRRIGRVMGAVTPATMKLVDDQLKLILDLH